MTPLVSLLKHHGIAYHLYADDTQLTDEASPEIAIAKMELCVASIRQRMKINTLKLHDDKTEFLVIHVKSANQQVLPDCVTVGNARISSKTHTETWETFDCILERHVTNISQAAYYHLHST